MPPSCLTAAGWQQLRRSGLRRRGRDGRLEPPLELPEGRVHLPPQPDRDQRLRERQEYDLAVLGEGDPVPPQAQEWYRRAVAEAEAAAAVRLVVEGAGEIVRRVTPLDLAVRTAAASDPDAARFLAQNEQLRLQGYREMVDFLAAKSPLRAGLPADRAADVLLLLLGPASHRTLVANRGWSHAEWVDWTSRTLTEQLFGIGATA